ncbi:hypothetical protein DZA28_04525 [Pseudomonas alloputida]|uniref:Uncharacterized protein n=2 Tax=Pseudomonas TaxID=286 RepID=A0ABD6MZ92_9PSED|nr:hypothetical protein CHN49_03915 [Pseudomonas putida]NWL46925.1 hypothetical protein [Pseudomonas hunanensis]TRZ59248.1 hypothetical protein DZA28_04525 [Pseudomonas alloputida]
MIFNLCWPFRGLARSHRDEGSAEPVGAGKPAKRPAQADRSPGTKKRPEGRFFVSGRFRRNAWPPGCFLPGPGPRRYRH